MTRYFDLTGKKFNKLTAIKLSHIKEKHTAYWEWICDCGKIKVIIGSNVAKGYTKSCGCINKRTTTHGYSRARLPEYKAWGSIKERCYNPNHKSYKRYGGRGIFMCDEWRNDFLRFYSDMGRKPTPQHSVERIENDKGYYKENCKWGLPIEQNNNTRSNKYLTHNGETLTYMQWAHRLGFNRMLIKNRLNLGWDVVRILTTPPESRIKNKSKSA